MYKLHFYDRLKLYGENYSVTVFNTLTHQYNSAHIFFPFFLNLNQINYTTLYFQIIHLFITTFDAPTNFHTTHFHPPFSLVSQLQQCFLVSSNPHIHISWRFSKPNIISHSLDTTTSSKTTQHTNLQLCRSLLLESKKTTSKISMCKSFNDSFDLVGRHCTSSREMGNWTIRSFS